MMSDKEIKEALDKKELIIKNFEEKFLHPSSYDARLGKQVFKTRPERGLVDASEKGVIIIEVGKLPFSLPTRYSNFQII